MFFLSCNYSVSIYFFTLFVCNSPLKFVKFEISLIFKKMSPWIIYIYLTFIQRELKVSIYGNHRNFKLIHFLSYGKSFLKQCFEICLFQVWSWHLPISVYKVCSLLNFTVLLFYSFSIPYWKLAQELAPLTSCLPCTCSKHWTIWPNNEKRRKGKQRFLKGAASWVKRQEVGVLKMGTGTPLETITP